MQESHRFAIDLHRAGVAGTTVKMLANDQQSQALGSVQVLPYRRSASCRMLTQRIT